MATTLQDLKEIRDEIRLKLHLASMDAKKQWETLEPKLEALEKDFERSVERGAEKVSGTAVELVDELADAYKKLREKIGSA